MRFLANRSELLPIARRCSQTIGTYFVSKEHACVLMEADAASNTVMFTARSRTCTLQVRHACRVEESGRALLFAPVFQRMLDAFADEPAPRSSTDFAALGYAWEGQPEAGGTIPAENPKIET